MDGTLSQFHLDALRDILMERIDGNDRRYEARFMALTAATDAAVAAQKEAVQAALLASDKAVQAAFLASEKAVQAAFEASEKASQKAEEAQSSYNERSNEFRGQLDDQAKTLMPRAEAAALAKAQDDKIDLLNKQLQELRFGVAGTAGALGASGVAVARDQQQSNWRVGVIIGISGTFMALAAVGVAIISLATR